MHGVKYLTNMFKCALEILTSVLYDWDRNPTKWTILKRRQNIAQLETSRQNLVQLYTLGPVMWLPIDAKFEGCKKSFCSLP